MDQHSRPEPVQPTSTRPLPSAVALRGEIDAATAPALTRRLLRLPTDTDVTVDLSQVRFMGAAGLTLLLTLREHLTRGDAALHLTGAPPYIRRIIALVGLRETLPCLPTPAITHTPPAAVPADPPRSLTQ